MMRIALSLFLLLSGCTALGVAAYKIAGPPAVKAKYKPAKTPLLVLVENYQRQSSSRVNGDLLARMVADQLDEHEVAPIIPLEKLTELRDAQPNFSTMSISAIGKALDAQQVLYIQVLQDNVTALSGGETLQGELLVRVKVVAVASGETLWPTDVAEGHEMSMTTQLGADRGGNVREVQERLDTKLSDEIAKLFYDWKPDY
jgi:hypothetical protein